MPVAKGNGYGFGLGRLARKAPWLGVDTLAVGTYDELPEVAHRASTATCWCSPRGGRSAPRSRSTRQLADRVIHTVSRVEDLEALLDRQPRRPVRARAGDQHAAPRPDRAASSRPPRGSLAARTRARRLEGVALHLPLAQGSHLSRGAAGWSTDVVAAGLGTRTLWVSHLTADELAALRASYADYAIRPRIGTDLWLGDRGALRVTATVLDVHQVERGDAFGYRGRTAPKAGHLLVVSGGTAHGIGLEAPTGERLASGPAPPPLARGGLDAVGLRALAVLHRRQAAALRRAAAHAGLDAVPARTAPGCRRSATRSTSRVRYTATDVRPGRRST